MDFTEVIEAEKAAETSFRKMKRIQRKFKERMAANHSQYAKRILHMRRSTLQSKPCSYFDKVPSSIPSAQAPFKQIFTSFDSDSPSNSSSSSEGSLDWPEFHEFSSQPRSTTAREQTQPDHNAELIRNAARLRQKYPRALSSK
jgi:hypothetical protein